MTKKLVLAISLCLVIEVGISQELSVSIGGGYERIIGPSQYSNPVSSSGLGLRESFPVNVGVHYTLLDETLTFGASGMYRSLSGKGTTFATGQTPNTILAGETRTRGSIWSASLGAKWLMTNSTQGPYLESTLLASSFKITTTWFEPPSGFDISQNNTQYGLTAGAGWGIQFLWNTMLDIDARFILDGLLTRENEQQGLTSFQLVASVVIPVWSAKSQE